MQVKDTQHCEHFLLQLVVMVYVNLKVPFEYYSAVISEMRLPYLPIFLNSIWAPSLEK